MGAWIEMQSTILQKLVDLVAPLVGAWIEILDLNFPGFYQLVAPLVGAWIEISKYRGIPSVSFKSLPSWERGLKSVKVRCMLFPP